MDGEFFYPQINADLRRFFGREPVADFRQTLGLS